MNTCGKITHSERMLKKVYGFSVRYIKHFTKRVFVEYKKMRVDLYTLSIVDGIICIHIYNLGEVHQVNTSNQIYNGSIQ